jgi:hypothetical protein
LWRRHLWIVHCIIGPSIRHRSPHRFQ